MFIMEYCIPMDKYIRICFLIPNKIKQLWAEVPTPFYEEKR